jgi:hypothetical protein
MHFYLDSITMLFYDGYMRTNMIPQAKISEAALRVSVEARGTLMPKGTEKQIAYAADLRAMFAPWVAEWKAMLPAGDPKAAALCARIDAAYAKLESLDAGRQIDIMQTAKSRELKTTEDRVRAAGMIVRMMEAK